MDMLDTLAILFLAVVTIGWLNERFLKLQNEIGLLLVALIATSSVGALDVVNPHWTIWENLQEFTTSIDFYAVVMVWMLPFLLFGDALHTSVGPVLARKWTIALLALVGTLLTTAIIGTSMWFILNNWLGIELPFLTALVFGAIVSPTDPIAVIAILKKHAVPETLEAKVAGESLFNDGIGVVVFVVLVQIAFAREASISPAHIAELFFVEAIGGIVLGAILGYGAYRWTKTSNQHNWEVLLTVALVFVLSSFARALHVSAPLGSVIAGLFIGNHGQKYGMVENTRLYLHKFWEVVHTGLIGMLFLLIGVEVFAIDHGTTALLATGIAIVVALVARFIVVAGVLGTLSIGSHQYTPGAIPVLTWGGVHGGISVAMALALPENPFKQLLLTMAYGVVVFSIVVQGLTMDRVIKRFVPQSSPSPKGNADV
ncbi:cation:proton antiporter [Thalassospira xiamenensis]|uniref:Sodium/proton antiporter, CPA1 family n=1 Tax=Thalassospira xiamenensis TaxID=220697 RepID=A0A285TWE1_9PROT|nr:sodium:proton antiporter [Thalassospira xiamenensis]SOC26598.1 sodium/proton antiporter, CPA1 family [Thalassospira xiamenensis]